MLRLQYKILSPFWFWAGRGGFIPYLYSYKIPSLVQIAATKYVGILPYAVHKLTFSNAFKYLALFYNDFLHVTEVKCKSHFKAKTIMYLQFNSDILQNTSTIRG